MRARAVPARIVAWQAFIGVLGALVWWLDSPTAALAALAGGLCSALLSLQVAVRVFSRPDSSPPQAIVAAFYRAETIKLVGAALMFGFMAKFFASGFVPFLTTFMATLVVYFVALRWQVGSQPDTPV